MLFVNPLPILQEKKSIKKIPSQKVKNLGKALSRIGIKIQLQNKAHLIFQENQKKVSLESEQIEIKIIHKTHQLYEQYGDTRSVIWRQEAFDNIPQSVFDNKGIKLTNCHITPTKRMRHYERLLVCIQVKISAKNKILSIYQERRENCRLKAEEKEEKIIQKRVKLNDQYNNVFSDLLNQEDSDFRQAMFKKNARSLH